MRRQEHDLPRFDKDNGLLIRPILVHAEAIEPEVKAAPDRAKGKLRLGSVRWFLPMLAGRQGRTESGRAPYLPTRSNAIR